MAKRRVWVWTPDGYESGDESFPVVYCQDGQNKMDKNTSWLQADWQLGRAASILQDEGVIVPTIFVLIENAGGLRFIEYADSMLGNAYVNWMCDTLKPYVDDRFRTSKRPESTFAMGSSMGASISFLAAYQRPDVFGGACCISPAFQTNTIASVLFDFEGFASNKYEKMKIYIDNGGSTKEKEVPFFDPRDGLQRAGYWWLDTQLQPSIDAMLFALESRGLTRASGRLKYIKFPGARHNENAWRRRVREPLTFILSQSEGMR
ncbi:hypothetical protein GUITHDRAFT_101734 [Guillardia theta CCMP2712]|uniref:Esterase n=2 Tax=Guillardia theta TaxID=55529 RepID=L1JW06_GUITC|nr:hypothetical protein GUITHDRAFT_101734 [Guillardia theta CCMP2712]EKX52567.1 hypothetical protein GUITHDRAFT_101734 [Guillardia theta CCMP2712]|eukprot:XP_005839547.1 hypothetical protein GUITHDRAFT_101734 [Guillardia theta CCMP2712]